MKKIFSILFVALVSLFCFAGCVVDETDPGGYTPDPGDGHTHSYNSQVWKYDENTHWHPSTCEHFTLRGSEAGHTMVNGECSVCGYSVTGMTVADFM